jgi:hypothetical protein
MWSHEDGESSSLGEESIYAVIAMSQDGTLQGGSALATCLVCPRCPRPCAHIRAVVVQCVCIATSRQCFLTNMANGDKVAIATRVSGDKVAIGCSRVAIHCFPCIDHHQLLVATC